MGMLKKAVSGVLALLPCSRIEYTLRASKGLRPCWSDFFEHSLQTFFFIHEASGLGRAFDRMELIRRWLCTTKPGFGHSWRAHTIRAHGHGFVQ